jgi:hypothetical protein
VRRVRNERASGQCYREYSGGFEDFHDLLSFAILRQFGTGAPRPLPIFR